MCQIYDDELAHAPSMSSRWAWVLQDALGIAFCLYMLKTVRLPTFKVDRHGYYGMSKVLFVFCFIINVCNTSAVFCLSAGLYFTTDGPFCLRYLLRIYYTIHYKGLSGQFPTYGCSGVCCLTLTSLCVSSTGWGKYHGGGGGRSL